MKVVAALPLVQVGWWYAYCCEEDLQQIEDEEELKELTEGDFLPEFFWPTHETAIAGLRADGLLKEQWR